MLGYVGPIEALTDGNSSFCGVRFTAGNLHADRLVEATKGISDKQGAARKSVGSTGTDSK